MAVVIIDTVWRWDRLDGSGTECCVCGDACWLEEFVLVVAMRHSGQVVGSTDCTVCTSCRDLMEDELRGEDES